MRCPDSGFWITQAFRYLLLYSFPCCCPRLEPSWPIRQDSWIVCPWRCLFELSLSVTCDPDGKRKKSWCGLHRGKMFWLAFWHHFCWCYWFSFLHLLVRAWALLQVDQNDHCETSLALGMADFTWVAWHLVWRYIRLVSTVHRMQGAKQDFPRSKRSLIWDVIQVLSNLV